MNLVNKRSLLKTAALSALALAALAGCSKKEEAPAPEVRKCDFCLEPVADEATRCPHCTSELKAKAKA